MGVLILVVFGLLALASANGIAGNGDFDFGTSDEANASDGTSTSDSTSTSDGLPTCDGVVVIDVDSEPIRVPGDTNLFSSASSTCGMSVGRGSEDAVVVLQDALDAMQSRGRGRRRRVRPPDRRGCDGRAATGRGHGRRRVRSGNARGNALAHDVDVGGHRLRQRSVVVGDHRRWLLVLAADGLTPIRQ